MEDLIFGKEAHHLHQQADLIQQIVGGVQLQAAVQLQFLVKHQAQLFHNFSMLYVLKEIAVVPKQHLNN
jgi:hypothetical protein